MYDLGDMMVRQRPEGQVNNAPDAPAARPSLHGVAAGAMKPIRHMRGGPSRPGFLRIDDVQDPHDGTGKSRIHAWVSRQELEQAQRHSLTKFWDVQTAVEVLRFPLRIYEGDSS